MAQEPACMTDAAEAGNAARQRRLLMGNQAIGIAAIEAGVNVACGYPGTPSTEIVETIAANNPDHAIHVEWSTNEKAALEVAAGVSYSGGRVIMTCKQVGMNVASDPLMSLAYVGCRGGLVLVVADDPGPISSQTEQDTRQFAQFAHVPVLDPATPEEAYAMTIAAFDLSEKYGCPVILRPTTRVDHGCASIDVPADLASIPRHHIEGFKTAADGGSDFVIFPPLSRRAHGRMARDLAAMGEEFRASPFNKLETISGAEYRASDAESGAGDESARLGIACGGDTRGYVREALARLAQVASDRGFELPSYRLLQIGTPFPFPDGLGRQFLSGLDRALVAEELEPVIERSLIELAGLMATTDAKAAADDGAAAACSKPSAALRLPVIHGRLDGTTPIAGEYSSDILLPILADFLGLSKLADSAANAGVSSEAATDAGSAVASGSTLVAPPSDLIPPRPPVLCAGCPHRASFLAVKQAVGARKAVYAGDIGCYTLGCNHPLDATDTCLCMGAGVTIAQGLGTAARLAGDDETLHVGFVGDSTFFASAMTGIANAVYNQHRMCLCVLDNATTAMTGSQPHPGTGVTLMGTRSKPISIPDVCRALGCEVVEVVDPLDQPAAVEAARRALDCAGVSVIVFRSPCVQLYRALEPVKVDDAACVGCGACVRKTGCPALSMAAQADEAVGGSPSRRGRPRAHVDPAQCVGCDLCLAYCRFGALKTPRKDLSPEDRDRMRREARRG